MAIQLNLKNVPPKAWIIISLAVFFLSVGIAYSFVRGWSTLEIHKEPPASKKWMKVFKDKTIPEYVNSRVMFLLKFSDNPQRTYCDSSSINKYCLGISCEDCLFYYKNLKTFKQWKK